MAFTASWIADEELELVELEVLDSPRSWANDSLVELESKLDRSELIELVLIPSSPLRLGGLRRGQWSTCQSCNRQIWDFLEPVA